MKKIISLLLILCLIFALTPAVYADGTNLSERYSKNVYAGILNDDGHLLSCGGDNCNCEVILDQADKEYAAMQQVLELEVWMRAQRDADGIRHDTVVAEVNMPYASAREKENQTYLDANKNLAGALEDFYGDDDVPEVLQRPADYIQEQVLGKLNYAEKNRSSGVSHLEYILKDKIGKDPNVNIGILDDSKGDDGEKYIFSREAFDADVPEHDVSVKVGSLTVLLPDDCADKAFSLGLSFNDNGSVHMLLVDEKGEKIPEAIICAPLPEDAGEDSTVVLLDGNGGTSPIEDSDVDNGCVVFTAPTGDDVFALTYHF